MTIEGSDVSVVIPAYGDCPYLDQVVEALLTQTVKPGEIIIVHSGPADPTPAMNGLDDRISCHHFDQRLYAAAARNFGIKQAGGRWTAFIDADILPTRTWLAELLRAISSKPRRFVVGSIGHAITGGYWGLCLWNIEFSQIHPYLPQRVIEGGASGNMLACTMDVISSGGFPEWMAASEDALLFAALRRNGLTNCFCPAARADHFNVGGIRHYCHHLFSYGIWSSISRKVMPLKGWFAIRLWPLASFFWVIRFSLIFCRAFRGGVRHWVSLMALAPGLVFGLLIWNAGYLKGIFKNLNDRRA